MKPLIALILFSAGLLSSVTTFARDEGNLYPEQWIKSSFENDGCNGEFIHYNKNTRRRVSHISNLDELLRAAPDWEKERALLTRFGWTSYFDEWSASTGFVTGGLYSTNERSYTRVVLNAAVHRLGDVNFQPFVKVTVSIRRPKNVMRYGLLLPAFHRAILPDNPDLGRVTKKEVNGEMIFTLELNRIPLNAQTLGILKGILERLDVIKDDAT
jgi:hypothetical protein